MRRGGESGEVEHGGAKIDRAHELIGDGSGDALGVGAQGFRDTHDERNEGSGIVEPPFCARQTHPVVGPEEDDGVLIQTVFFELIDEVPGPGIEGTDEFVISFPIFPHHGSVGVIRREGGKFGRILTMGCGKVFGNGFVFGFAANAGFVAAPVVKHGEEGFFFIFTLGQPPVAFS